MGTSSDLKAKHREWSRRWYSKLTPEQKAYRQKRIREREAANPNTAVVRKKWLAKNKASVKAKAAETRARNKGAFIDSSPSWEEVELWIAVQDSAACPYCGELADSLDHKVPIARHGLHTIDNLQMTCNTCNLAKKDRTPEEFLSWIHTVYKYTLGDNDAR